MTTSVLVTYATHHGSTREVAEDIAATLRERGLEVDLEPVRAIHRLDGYRAVVFGAPMYVGHWPKEAQQFLARHCEALNQRAVAVFALGPLSTDENETREARTQLDKELAKFPTLAPVAVEMFGGRFDPATLSWCEKLLVALPASPLHGMPATDLRDWTAIRAWSGDLAQTLGSPSPPPADAALSHAIR
jgi:menaquinone-dependent protoporphyrinogen oxidase